MNMVPPGGKHLLVDYWGILEDLLDDEERIKQILIDGAILGGATILSSHMHHFGENYGVSGVIVLAESHVSWHSWKVENYCAIDIFMCGNCDPEKTEEYYRDTFQPLQSKVKMHIRGNF